MVLFSHLASIFDFSRHHVIALHEDCNSSPLSRGMDSTTWRANHVRQTLIKWFKASCGTLLLKWVSVGEREKVKSMQVLLQRDQSRTAQRGFSVEKVAWGCKCVRDESVPTDMVRVSFSFGVHLFVLDFFFFGWILIVTISQRSVEREGRNGRLSFLKRKNAFMKMNVHVFSALDLRQLVSGVVTFLTAQNDETEEAVKETCGSYERGRDSQLSVNESPGSRWRQVAGLARIQPPAFRCMRLCW